MCACPSIVSGLLHVDRTQRYVGIVWSPEAGAQERKGTVPHGSGLHQSQMLRKAGWATVARQSPSPHKRTQRVEDRNGDHASDITALRES